MSDALSAVVTAAGALGAAALVAFKVTKADAEAQVNIVSDRARRLYVAAAAIVGGAAAALVAAAVEAIK